MMVFKTTLYRLSKSTIFWILTIGIPILFVLSVIMVGNNKGDNQAKICTIAIIDEDDSVASKALQEILAENYNINITKEDDMHNTLLEQLADVGLKINEGFGNDLKNGEIPQIEIISFSISSFLEMVKNSADNSIDSLRILSINTTDEGLINRLEKFKTERSFQYEKIVKTDYSMIMVLFGILSFLYLYMGSIVTKPFLEDKISGIRFRNKTMPMSLLNYNIQSILAYFIPLLSLSFIACFATLIIVEISIISFLALLLSTSIFSFLCICMAMTIYAFLDNFAAAMGIYSILTTILGMLGGAFWPISFLPNFLKMIAYFNPVYWFMISIEVIKGDFSSYYISIIIMILTSIILLLIPELKKFKIKRGKLKIPDLN